jgi:hypothetical protein
MNGSAATYDGGYGDPAESHAHTFTQHAFARLQAPNPLLYRCFPLTCARSQE